MLGIAKKKSISKDGADSFAPNYRLGQGMGEPTHGATRGGAYFLTALLAIVVFLLSFAVVYAARGFLDVWAIAVPCALAGLFAYSSHITMDWERSVVVRFGKFSRIAGPGLFFTIPLVEFVAARVDQRMITTSFEAEETLTSDLVPVNVDAVLFWMVWDARKACFEVADYPSAVSWAAQTTLRDAIGQITLAEITSRRDQLDLEMRKTIEAKTEAWGITILSVEIRDIVIPKELQDAMSKEAQAECERNARVVLAEVERDISEMFSGAADVYREDPVALQLRQMNLVYESVKDRGSMFLVPCSMAESLKGESLDRDVLIAQIMKEQASGLSEDCRSGKDSSC